MIFFQILCGVSCIKHIILRRASGGFNPQPPGGSRALPPSGLRERRLCRILSLSSRPLRGARLYCCLRPHLPSQAARWLYCCVPTTDTSGASCDGVIFVYVYGLVVMTGPLQLYSLVDFDSSREGAAPPSCWSTLREEMHWCWVVVPCTGGDPRACMAN